MEKNEINKQNGNNVHDNPSFVNDEIEIGNIQGKQFIKIFKLK